METELTQALSLVSKFVATDLGASIKVVENRLIGLPLKSVMQDKDVVEGARLFASANIVKAAASQINNIVHAAGILGALPKLLEPGEVVEFVSLGAGTGKRRYDLATNLRLAEFKFYNWRGADSARESFGLAAFINLAEADDLRKRREMYFQGTEPFVRFMTSGRKLATMLAKGHAGVLERLRLLNPAWVTVGDYYASRKTAVDIKDITPLLS